MAEEQLEVHGAGAVMARKVSEGLGSRVCTITRLDGTAYNLLAPTGSLLEYARLATDSEPEDGEDN